MYKTVDSDYYGVINADILISDSIFSILDQIDLLVANHTISSIVLSIIIYYDIEIIIWCCS